MTHHTTHIARIISLTLAAVLSLPMIAAAKSVPKKKSSHTQTETAAVHETPLSPEQMGVAQLIQTGHMPCELGNSISVNPIANAPGRFTIQIGKTSYRVSPVVTSTGVIRLEDLKSGVVLIQQATKSMLLNEKQGRRLADECKSMAQADAAARYQQ